MQALQRRLQTMLDSAAESSGVAGCQVSIILDNERLDLAHGSANRELNIPMTPDTLVQVGSVCKVFNAALIMALVERNKLELDTPVIRYIPELTLSDEVARQSITLRQLLSMSSGLDNGPYAEQGRGDDALQRYVAALREIPQVFAPGSGFGYSNAGTAIAGYVAERVAGQSWDSLMRQMIFEPAGLSQTVTLAEDLPFHRVSVGHTRHGNGVTAAVVRPWYITRAQGPCGSTLAMSARDLASFGQIFIGSGKTATGQRVLAEDSVSTMMTPTTDVPVSSQIACCGRAWGLGPSMDYWNDTLVWGHSGGNRSGSSRLVWFPQMRGVLAVTMNTPESDEAFMIRMLGDFSKTAFGIAAELPVFPKTAVAVADPRRFLGRYRRHGACYEIGQCAGDLRFREFSCAGDESNEHLELRCESTLVPLGGDRFLLSSPGTGPNPVIPMIATVGFFGADEQRRATNIVASFLAGRRTN